MIPAPPPMEWHLFIGRQTRQGKAFKNGLDAVNSRLSRSARKHIATFKNWKFWSDLCMSPVAGVAVFVSFRQPVPQIIDAYKAVGIPTVILSTGYVGRFESAVEGVDRDYMNDT